MKFSWKGHKDRNRHKNRIKGVGKFSWFMSKTQTATSPPLEGEPVKRTAAQSRTELSRGYSSTVWQMDWVRNKICFHVDPQELLLTTLKRRKLVWFCHVTRHDNLYQFPLRTPWGADDAMVSWQNVGRITSKSGHPCPCQNFSHWPPAKKDRKTISAKSSLMFPRWPYRLRDWTELNWAELNSSTFRAGVSCVGMTFMKKNTPFMNTNTRACSHTHIHTHTVSRSHSCHVENTPIYSEKKIPQ